MTGGLTYVPSGARAGGFNFPPAVPHTNIPIFIPHYGCGNECVFCDQRAITGNREAPEPRDIPRIVSDWLRHSKASPDKTEIAFFGGSFTGLPLDKQTEYLKTAYKLVKSGKASGIRLSTRPDYIAPDILENLNKYGVTAVELGVQSLSDEVLRLSKRGHTAEDVESAVGLIRGYPFKLGLQMMCGLPGDGGEESLYTAREIARLNPDFARFYPAVILKGTELERMAERGDYTPLTLEEAVKICAEVLKILQAAGIPAVRLGLAAADNLRENYIAGPFHPAFGELVYSRIYRDLIEEYIVLNNVKNAGLNVTAPERFISQISGQKRENIIYFKNKYSVGVKLFEGEGFFIEKNGHFIVRI